MPTNTTPAIGDVRTVVMLAPATPEVQERLRGRRCAACGARGRLRPGGHAYKAMRRGENPCGYPVRVCLACPATVPNPVTKGLS